jgi:hypothetical protein
MRTSAPPSHPTLLPPACRWLTCALLFVLEACAPESSHVTWTLGFAEPALKDETVDVSAFIVDGGCSGTDRVYESSMAMGVTGAAPDSLSPGRYGFAAEARDSECRTVATGCIERELPTSAPIDVMLNELRSPAPCDASECIEGRCVNDEADAGMTMSDGGTSPGEDAGTLADAGPIPDAGDCPGGIRRPGGHCYRYVGSASAFAAARSTCGSWGGSADLLVLDSAAEESWVEANVAPLADYWLGISDNAVEGTWLTITSTTPAYVHWAGSGPSGGNASDCGTYGVADDLWHDSRCNEASAIVCERP